MLASVQDLLDYDLEPAPEILEEVSLSFGCALCSAEPLAANASYADTLHWLETRHPTVADRLREVYAEELAESDAVMGGGRSRGNVDTPIRWHDVRKTFAHDSKLLPGYAVSVVTLQIAMAQMAFDRREAFRDTFLVALCDICSTNELRSERPRERLLRSYVNQWAGGNAFVARSQSNWLEIESIANFIEDSSQPAFGGLASSPY